MPGGSIGLRKRFSRFAVAAAAASLAVAVLVAASGGDAWAQRGWGGGGGGFGGGGGGFGGGGRMGGDGDGMMKKRKGGMKGRFQPSEPYDYFEKRGLFSVGLEPVFPDGVSCPAIASPFGSQVRYDGSQRHNDHYGYHGGMDISLDPGTPLLAIADGEVIHKGEGGQMTGYYVWLRFAPEDTGLPIYLFAKYQHLKDMSPLEVGSRVKVGDVVGPSGDSGTKYGYFREFGYAHLHLSLFGAKTGEFEIEGSKVRATGNWMLDPVGVYVKKAGVALENHALRDMSDDDKKVPIPYQTMDGRRMPEGTRLVWPVNCKTN